MTPSRPYLIRAIYDWLIDNKFTAYVAVDARVKGTIVPEKHVKDGKIIMDISPSSVRELSLRNDGISFQARFSGIVHMIELPIASVMAVYAAENGRGMVFGKEDPFAGTADGPEDDGGGDDGGDDGGGSHLRVIK